MPEDQLAAMAGKRVEVGPTLRFGEGRGKPIVTLTNQTTALLGVLRQHSRKPAEFYELVEALCPGNKLEMFAREARPDWQAWSAEADLYAAAG
jgi:N6-adenosine-specific RNA methylase IME4